MRSDASTVDQYLAALPEDRQAVISAIRNLLKQQLPEGFAEEMSYGMIAYNVPHRLFPAGYHCDPAQALPFISLASQKNFVALYHMGLYADPELLNWFTGEYPRHSKRKLDMGKSCIRFKNMADIPYELIGELAAKMTPQQWIVLYQKNLQR